MCSIFSQLICIFVVKIYNMVNTYNRYIWLLNTLLVYKRLTFEEIKNKWDYSSLNDGKKLNLRTYHDHRNAVEEIFKVNILCDSSDGYKYYIEDEATLMRDTAHKWLLNSFNVIGLVNDGQDMRDRILLEDIPSSSKYLSDIVNAMRQNVELEIEYQSYDKDAPALYHIRPYCMRIIRQRWYVLGFLVEDNGLRHIALDRIKSLKVSDIKFDYPNDFSPEKYYEGSVGIFVNENFKPEEVVIRAFGKRIKMLRDLPLHKSQTEITMKNDYSEFRYYLSVTHELVLDLLGMGSSVEVVKPEGLREMVRDEIKSMFMKYRND